MHFFVLVQMPHGKRANPRNHCRRLLVKADTHVIAEAKARQFLDSVNYRDANVISVSECVADVTWIY